MREVRRAIEVGPSDPDAHMFYSTLLCFVGRNSEATAKVEYTLKLNPSSLLAEPVCRLDVSPISGQHARAEAQARRTIELFPDSLQPSFVLGWAAWCQGRAEEAVAVLEKALSHSREPLSFAYLGHIYGRLGRTDEARRLLQELEQLRTQVKPRRSPSRQSTLDSAILTRRSIGSKPPTGSGTVTCSGFRGLRGSIRFARIRALPISSNAWGVVSPELS